MSRPIGRGASLQYPAHGRGTSERYSRTWSWRSCSTLLTGRAVRVHYIDAYLAMPHRCNAQLTGKAVRGRDVAAGAACRTWLQYPAHRGRQVREVRLAEPPINLLQDPLLTGEGSERSCSTAWSSALQSKLADPCSWARTVRAFPAPDPHAAHGEDK